jgi:hypothetical protein
MEDRLNPIPPEGVDESTLGGYPAVHGRAPGFEGVDGCAYTVAIEIEEAEEGSDEWIAYLVFLRWADHGSAIMGHLETDDLARAPTPEAARTAVEALPLTRVKEILDEVVRLKREWEAERSG